MGRFVSQNDRVKVINRNNSSRYTKRKKRRWNALDPSMCHPFDDEANDNTQQANQQGQSVQHSYESIVIRDSCDIDVSTTETQVAVNLQVAIQAAISLVVSLSITDTEKAELVTQDLQTNLRSSQFNRQETYIENSRGVNVTTTDTDIAVNAQLLLLVLVALLVRLDIL